MQQKSVLFLILFTISLVAPICTQVFFDASEISSFVTTDEESKADTFELESEKITEEITSFQTDVKFRKVRENVLGLTRNSFWNTIYEAPIAPPPKLA